ncbi:hypothetical protein ABZ816_24600 [Actinosynnema sp. NPDC047251]|uniref:Uncharacterized protein n=1 Tax=Saccharothrix espanaensis (strain ATCC 51144 / DSM 44229 / JCM 9112 / NBRC 15066 / NRRL 15764) TaxID=1179773 RepID=K0K1X0_SACES|nr:hypothetical protein [Saccharothrix espanaensis]CCH32341.1 hypothetical protein BN6_50740 [Saccharothrix espanaensis DSM 44229]
MKPQRAVASFDSASAFLRVLAGHLHGRSSPVLGLGPAARAAGRVLPLVNRLPVAVREALYTWSGWSEAVREGRLHDVDSDEIARWAAGHYPRRRYPAVVIGSSSGALVHLAALAGVPWLPQTFLVPVRRHGIHPDRPREAMTALADARAAFLGANPHVAVHHMHDANQDRLMIRHMAYFRFKYRRLPAAYADFLDRHLEPGGTVLISDCAESRPTTSTGPRQFFQHGAVGGATEEEYARGGPRVAEFLAGYGSPVRAWDSPDPDSQSPEAEWGFDPALVPDLARLCAQRGWTLERLGFPSAQALSEPVAEAHRAWYTEQGVTANRLLVSSFALIDAHLPLTLGFVPYWTVFSTLPARDALDDYLRRAAAYDEIRLGVFSHGTRSIGLATPADWDLVLSRARHGACCGVDRAAFPLDFAANARFHEQAAKLPPAANRPGPAPWTWVRDRLGGHIEPVGSVGSR